MTTTASIDVRTATHSATERNAIRDVVGQAFRSEDEVGLVEGVWASRHYLPDLDLVAVAGGRVVGHVLHGLGAFVGSGLLAPALAPLAVVPEEQRHGVGTALALEAIRRAEVTGYPLIVVTGHPDYYPRFGFEPAMPLGIDPRDPSVYSDPNAFMVRRLSAYAGERGTFLYSWERGED